MSFMVVKCPFCGETYTFGVVGVEQIGPGHTCTAELACDYCDEPARFLAAEHVDQIGIVGESFVCEAHVGDRVLLACQARVSA